jgi:hypothetical protein
MTHKLWSFLKKNILLIIVFGAGVTTALIIAFAATSFFSFPGNSGASVALTVSSPFQYNFLVPGQLNEAGSMDESTSPYWWLNSGGYFTLKNNVGMTAQGSVPSKNSWYRAYASSNALDTDGGTHPQNLFRLVTRSKWESVRQEASYYIVKDNFSSSPNHNASNGLLLMSRYADAGQTLYYAGIRVDGTAVIKKKYKGVYYTMAQEKVFPGTYSGTQDDKNLIPHQQWIRLRSDTKTNSGGTVTITLSMQLPGKAWQVLLAATDTGKNYGGTPPISASGYAGIRTDFMDVQFKDYRLEKI